MLELDESELALESRLSNVITLMIPVRPYILHCAWTQEVPLPAIEEFTCRLLVLLNEVLPGNIREYFGLTQRECEALIEGLVHNRLAVYTESGHLAPSPLLRNKAQANGDTLPSLTRYEERVETPIFDLLTLSMIAPRKQHRHRYGLPYLDICDEFKHVGQQEIMEAFGQQYHTYLEQQQKSERETRHSRLYKISSCEAGDLDLVAIDVAITLESTQAGSVRMTKTAEDKGNNRRPLTVEMESKISDFLNQQGCPESGLSFEQYCEKVDDQVLVQHIKRGNFDFNSWLNARRESKTGYGTPQTQAMVGPIYLAKNRLTIQRLVRDKAKYWPEEATFSALWVASKVPLWASNGQLISDFVYNLEPMLSASREGSGSICAVMSENLRSDNRAAFSQRIPNGLTFDGVGFEDRMEIFLIPDQLAVVQFHCQPRSDSAITVPIGYITIDPERIALVESILRVRLAGRYQPTLAWAAKDRTLSQLFDAERFISSPRPSQQTQITFKPKKRII